MSPVAHFPLFILFLFTLQPIPLPFQSHLFAFLFTPSEAPKKAISRDYNFCSGSVSCHSIPLLSPSAPLCITPIPLPSSPTPSPSSSPLARHRRKQFVKTMITLGSPPLAAIFLLLLSHSTSVLSSLDYNPIHSSLCITTPSPSSSPLARHRRRQLVKAMITLGLRLTSPSAAVSPLPAAALPPLIRPEFGNEIQICV